MPPFGEISLDRRSLRLTSQDIACPKFAARLVSSPGWSAMQSKAAF
jgi:hypothetical protein